MQRRRIVARRSKSRAGKGYELTVMGLLVAAGFDAYLPLVDDQAIDGIIRLSDGINTVYFDVQIKGGMTWSGIRCKTGRLSPRSVLLLYCASVGQVLWLLSADVKKHFKVTGSSWGDVFLRKQHVERFFDEGKADLDALLTVLWTQSCLNERREITSPE